MHIAHFITSLDLAAGGVVRAVLDLTTHLAERGHRMSILTERAPDVPPEWANSDIAPKVIELGRTGNPFRPLSREACRTAEAVIREADALHLHGIWQTECFQLFRIARRCGCPHAVSVHGMLDDWCMAQKTLKKRMYHTLALRRMLETAGVVHCTARAELEQAGKWFPKGRGVVVPLIFDLEPFRELPGEGPARRAFPDAFGDEPMLLFLSRIHEKKGIDRLIQAIGVLRSRGIACRVVIAGSGEDRYVKQLIRMADAEGVGDRVRFIGFASGVEKVSLYESATIFVLPTSQENWGFVLPEAMACSTPVITTYGVDIWPELKDSGGAVITSISSVDELAGAIEELLGDPERMSRMGVAGRTWVMDHLDPEKTIDQYIRLYGDLRH